MGLLWELPKKQLLKVLVLTRDRFLRFSLRTLRLREQYSFLFYFATFAREQPFSEGLSIRCSVF
ncbi:MAG: hypothetical protein A2X56_06975 [Nitrospirae bacterium GWC2_57_13]|nr:MAG: hypothetical protein A2X56_06975 [Nitrospirae bacterium GWC2_57_13]HAS53977.1 hypothetical protein [Nitrospiraceae bacterium]